MVTTPSGASSDGDAGDEVVEVGHVRQHVVRDDEVGRRCPRVASCAPRVCAEEATSVGHARLRRPRAATLRGRLDAEHRDARRRRSTAAGSRRCSRPRRPGCRPSPKRSITRRANCWRGRARSSEYDENRRSREKIASGGTTSSTCTSRHSLADARVQRVATPHRPGSARRSGRHSPAASRRDRRTVRVERRAARAAAGSGVTAAHSPGGERVDLRGEQSRMSLAALRGRDTTRRSRRCASSRPSTRPPAQRLARGRATRAGAGAVSTAASSVRREPAGFAPRLAISRSTSSPTAAVAHRVGPEVQAAGASAALSSSRSASSR